MMLSHLPVMFTGAWVLFDINIETKINIINNITFKTEVLIVIGIISFLLGIWRADSIVNRNTVITDILSAILIVISFGRLHLL
jgi:uncharacterized membrane protein YiaA